MKKSSMAIANQNIYKCINEQGISIRQLALDINMDPSHLRKIINGKLPLSLSYIDRICQRLEFPVYTVFIDSSVKVIPHPYEVNIQITANAHCILKKIDTIVRDIVF